MEHSTSNGLCRCCLSEGSFKRLSHEYRWLGEREVYADMLQECFSFSVSAGDENNRLICEVCITRLRDAFNFKKQVLASDDRLRCGLRRPPDDGTRTLAAETDAVREEKFSVLEVKVESPDDDDGSVGADDVDDTDMPIKFEETKVEFMDEEEEPLIVLSRAKKGTKRKAEPALERTKQRSVSAPNNQTKVVLAPAKKMLKITTTAQKPSKTEKPSTSKEPVKKDETTIKATFKLINNVLAVLKNSTAMPFRWQRNRFKCFFCPASIADQTALRRHVHQEHSGANLDLAVKHNVRAMRATNVKIDVSTLACNICSQRTASFDLLVRHLIETHDVNYDRSLVGCILPFDLTELNCFTCNEKFEFFSSLLLHVNRHVADCICEICGGSFVTYRAMCKHRLKAHKEQCDKDELFRAATKPLKNQFKCKTCGACFPSEYRRRSHMASAHDVRYDFKCPHCDREFQNQSTVAKHVKQTHLKERNFACEVCGDRFFDRQHVRLHMVRHYSEKVFSCEICKKAFARKKTLMTHLRTHSSERKYQ